MRSRASLARRPRRARGSPPRTRGGASRAAEPPLAGTVHRPASRQLQERPDLDDTTFVEDRMILRERDGLVQVLCGDDRVAHDDVLRLGVRAVAEVTALARDDATRLGLEWLSILAESPFRLHLSFPPLVLLHPPLHLLLPSGRPSSPPPPETEPGH